MWYDAEYDMWFDGLDAENGMNTPVLPEDDFWGVHGGYGFVCWFSKRFWDIHDYNNTKEKQPQHFIDLECDRCHKKFTI